MLKNSKDNFTHTCSQMCVCGTKFCEKMSSCFVSAKRTNFSASKQRSTTQFCLFCTGHKKSYFFVKLYAHTQNMETYPCNIFQIFLAFRNVFSEVGSYVPGFIHELPMYWLSYKILSKLRFRGKKFCYIVNSTILHYCHFQQSVRYYPTYE